MSNFKQGIVVFRTWEQSQGLAETRHSFSSVEELFELCLKAGSPNMVDRVVLEGTDDEGDKRMLVLAFQSITGRDEL